MPSIDLVRLVVIILLIAIIGVGVIALAGMFQDTSTAGRAAFQEFKTGPDYYGTTPTLTPAWVVRTFLPAVFGGFIEWSFFSTVIGGLGAMLIVLLGVKLVRVFLGSV